MKALPTSQSWNNFWELKSASKLSRPSQSKRRMMALLDTVIEPGMRALDAGCGSGFFSKYFNDCGCETYTLDYSRDALELAREVTEGKSKEYLCDNLLDPEFGSRHTGRYDVIFTDGLFEHFVQRDQVRIIDNFVAAKSERGTITTFVPNLLTWWTPLRPFLMPGIEETPFTLEVLKNLHSPLEIERCGGINVIPLPFSPDALLGSRFGMLVYCFAK